MIGWAWATWALAADGWQRPPAAIEEVLLAPGPPLVSPDPTGRTVLLLTPVDYPPLADRAVPFLQLAGERVDPRLAAPWGEAGYLEPTLQDVASGKRTPLNLPPGHRVVDWAVSTDGRRLAFAVRGPDAVKLFLSTDGQAPKEVPELALSRVLGATLRFMPDQRHVLVRALPAGPLRPPEPGLVPDGPIVSESVGAEKASTYDARDLLRTSFDDQLFEVYGTSRVVLVDAEDGKIRQIGQPDVYGGVWPSPDGEWLLVDRLRPPWSHRTTWDHFAASTEVWTLGGEVRVVSETPADEAIPIHGVSEGPRDAHWRQNADAALVWTEALDGGDPGRPASHRDRLMTLPEPFDGEAKELFRAAHRVQGVQYGDGGLVVIEQYERERRWRHVWTMDARFGAPSAKAWFDLSANERYLDPGRPVTVTTPDGRRLVARDGETVWFSGDGASPEGDRPFLDQRTLGTPAAVRVFRSATDRYERFLGFVGGDPGRWWLRGESTTAPPVVSIASPKGKVRAPAEGEATVGRSETRVVTFTDPTPVLRGIQHRIVQYQRKDGVPLSFHLYLPPGYKEGTRLPTVLYAYPREFSDPATAGQVAGSEDTFLRIRGASHLFYLLDGYAVLDQTAMPVLGDPDTAYDTFVDQLVMDAEAAIDEAVRLGVTDRDRVGVLGHSHGALMVATLLAHTDLFRAGIARSGAYNHTIRPFGFQNERRTLWEATDSYLAMAPVMFAPEIDAPLLLIHGAADQNPGTLPFQSDRLYDAVRGTGGHARLVMLPFEGHGYLARESVEHVVAEQLAWFDAWVKPPAP